MARIIAVFAKMTKLIGVAVAIGRVRPMVACQAYSDRKFVRKNPVADAGKPFARRQIIASQVARQRLLEYPFNKPQVVDLMIKSMTAFGRREVNGESGQLVCELRAVNHRYLELFVRLPDDLRALEMSVREKIGKKLKRGKVECTLRYKPSEIVGDIEINDQLTAAVLSACEQIDSKLSNQAPISAIEILRWPGVVSQRERDFDPVQKAAMELLDETLADFVATREREGQLIEKMILDRCESIAKIVAEQRTHRPMVMQRLRDRLQQKLDELTVEPDQQRLEQELVFAAQKLDVDEELDRLEAHITEVNKVLRRDEPVGRRLDFLMQELNREANTLGSKSQDATTTGSSVDLKVLIEQMREQVQNVE